MIAISPISRSGAGQVFDELFDPDFRIKQVGRYGQWIGEGRDVLGLTSSIRREDLQNLLEGLIPDGKAPLISGRNDPTCPCAWHVQFTAPGSVAVFWALAPPDVRETIFRVHSEAVASFALTIPHPWDDHHPLDPNLLFACFCYGASKELTPELGAHAILINAGFRANGKRTVITGKDLLKRILDPSGYYSSLSQGLAREIGDLRPENRGSSDYCIPAVPPELYRQLGTANHSDSEKHESFFLPDCPRHFIDPELLFKSWRGAAQRFGWGPREVEGIIRSTRREKAYDEFYERTRLGYRLWKERHDRIEAATDYLVAGQFLERRKRKAAVERAKSIVQRL